MVQAECIITAICEPMSREQPLKSTNRRPAHPEFLTVLEANVPHPVLFVTDTVDHKQRSNHLEGVFAALNVYLAAVIPDIAQRVPDSTLDRYCLDPRFQQLAADPLGLVRSAAVEMRIDESRRIS